MSRKYTIPPKEELEELYYNSDKPISKNEISKIYKVSRPVVDRWFKNYGMVEKDHDTICRELNTGRAYKIPTYEELYDLYITRQMTLTDLIKYYPVTGKDIRKWLKQYNDPYSDSIRSYNFS